MTLSTSERESDIVRSLTRLAGRLVSGDDQFELLSDLSDSCARILDADAAGVSVHDGEALRFVAASSEQMRLIELFQAEQQEGPCLDAFRSGAHVHVADLHDATTRWPSWTPKALHLGFQAADAFPLRLRDESVGALNVYSAATRQLPARDVAVAQAFADIATIAMLQERALADQKVVRDQLQRALDSRVLIEQAKGIIAERNRVHVDDAFEAIRHHARSTNTRIGDVARDIVDGRLHL